MFYDVQQFTFARALADSWLSIRDEMRLVAGGEFKLWPEHSLYGDKGWETFGLYAFGQRQADGCSRCPRTEHALRKIPGLMMAGFSRLSPGTHINPHRGYEGYAGYVLRLHLGLEIPDGCALRVESETRTWREGECLVFDDSFEHEAWNKSSLPRTVLLIDFLNPLRKRPLVLNPKFTPELIDFIENEHLPTQPISQRFLWNVWKLRNSGLVRRARRSIKNNRP